MPGDDALMQGGKGVGRIVIQCLGSERAYYYADQATEAKEKKREIEPGESCR